MSHHDGTPRHWIWCDDTLNLQTLSINIPSIDAKNLFINPIENFKELATQSPEWGHAWHAKRLPKETKKYWPTSSCVIQGVGIAPHPQFLSACIDGLTKAGYQQHIIFRANTSARLREYIRRAQIDVKGNEKNLCSVAVQHEHRARLNLCLVRNKLKRLGILKEIHSIESISQAPSLNTKLKNLISSGCHERNSDFEKLCDHLVLDDIRANEPLTQHSLEIRIKAEAIWCATPEMTGDTLHPIFSLLNDSLNVKEFRASPLPDELWEGEKFKWAGTVYIKGQSPEDELTVQQGRSIRKLAWGEPSPALQAKYPEDFVAGSCRFKEVTLTAISSQPIHIGVKSKLRQDYIGRIAFERSTPPPLSGILIAPFSCGYTPIPKTACTSIKEFLFELMMGHNYKANELDNSTHVHQFFDRRSCDISTAIHRLIVVRDPIRRFLSGYSNRILHHRELSEDYILRQPNGQAWLKKNIPLTPDINTFVEYLDAYRDIETIDHHFRPISSQIPSLEGYTKVYPFESIGEFFNDISKISHRTAPIQHTQKGGPKIDRTALSKSSLQKLQQFFEADYQLLKKYYSFGH